jgi:hypothetical protein
LIVAGKYFLADSVYTDFTWAEDMATQGCDQSADPAAGIGAANSRPSRLFWLESGKSQGFGDRVPKQERERRWGNSRMRTSICWIIAVIVASGVAVGQQRSVRQGKVLTVCEVLSDVANNADSVVIVVGRMERSVSLIDHYEFLSQDQCDRPVVTHGHVWSDRIQIWTAWETGMPKPPSDRPKIERSIIAEKLLIVQKATKLGVHQEPQFKSDGNSAQDAHTAAVPNVWAAVYGRIVRPPYLDEDCGATGCGGDNVPVVIIAEPYNVHRLSEGGTPFPEDQ